ncbi:hypothetical protein VSS74_11930 [Conexibacter stalactiti]|uniref:Lipoprotein n=1 Tax=Conexibacter stalactiti TaxID=1940611 RepID=A0ABU4HP18_9ACTN|nr:hypothetical protein [Conexibacter stalactiti]MDW5595053.1 hypothetical protein [Conexibacter stalactiti]MEC5035695.1 hypothetical protein [Conexibacter stalactiti]
MGYRGRGIVLGAALVGVVSAPVGTSVANAGQPAAGAADQAVVAKKQPRRAVDRRLYKRFSLLRKKQSARPAVDYGLLPPLPYGVVLNAARSVTTANDVSITVAPGSAGTCILMTDPKYAPKPVGIGCSPIATTLAGEQWTYNSFLGGLRGTLVGVVPDNVVAALVTHADGSPERVPVVNNVWSVRGHADYARSDLPFTRVQVQDKSGTFTSAFAKPSK